MKRGVESESKSTEQIPDSKVRHFSSDPGEEQPIAQHIEQLIQYEPPQLSAQCYEQGSTEPVSFYISSLEELRSWKPCAGNEDFNSAVRPVAGRHPALRSDRPRTLVCHDMAGGYLTDRFVQGVCEDNPFVFYHWQYIDVFVYFSHQMVTIPPVCWTNAAHKHGVSVLGTFITEWKGGARACEEFLQSEEMFRPVADKLALIARCSRFDGWLINIENPLSAGAVKNLPAFLGYLRDQMRRAVPGSLVIWYDSVLETGDLKWQNELNQHNKTFFDSCDGIFLNYNWKEEHLERAAAAGEGRASDVYVGIDVFARGDVVGGKFTTNESFKLIRKYNLSAALFAPGWVYETLGKREFHKNQHKFWNMLMEYLPTHSSCSLPFVTSFCQGFGQNLYRNGKVEVAGNWLNLSAQEIQPLFTDRPAGGAASRSWVRTYGCSDDAWNGGSSFVITGLVPAPAPDTDTSALTVSLFHLYVDNPPARIFLSFVYKLEGGVSVSPELLTCALSRQRSDQDPTLDVLKPSLLPDDDGLVQQFVQSSGCWSPGEWTARFFLVEMKDIALRGIQVRVALSQENDQEDVRFKCRIGEIRILDAAKLKVKPNPVKNLTVGGCLWRTQPKVTDPPTPTPPTTQLSLSATLQWANADGTVGHFNIYCRGLCSHKAGEETVGSSETALVGRANANVYRAVDLTLRQPAVGTCRPVEFLVQPVSEEGFPAPLSACRKVVVNCTRAR